MTHHLFHWALSELCMERAMSSRQTSNTVGHSHQTNVSNVMTLLRLSHHDSPLIYQKIPLQFTASKSNKPVLWARSAGPTGWTPASWWTPASLADFGSRSAPRLHRCWPTTLPSFVGTSPSCGPCNRKKKRFARSMVHSETDASHFWCNSPLLFASATVFEGVIEV